MSNPYNNIDELLKTTAKNINTIYGLPSQGYINNSGNNLYGQNQNNSNIGDSTITLVHSQDDDIWQQGYMKIKQIFNNNAGLLSAISTKQWGTREKNSKNLSGQQFTFYTDLNTKDLGSNLEVHISNSFQKENKSTLYDQIQKFLSGTKLGNLTNELSTTADMLMSGLQHIDGTVSDTVTGFYGTAKAIINIFKLIRREGLNIWEDGEMTIKNRFKIILTQYSENEVESMVYTPYAQLVKMQSPHTHFIGGNSDAASLNFSVQEKVPPLDIIFKVNNGFITYNHQVISNLNSEFTELKYVNGKYKPTKIEITLEIASILPFQNYVDNFLKNLNDVNTNLTDNSGQISTINTETAIAAALTNIIEPQQNE